MPRLDRIDAEYNPELDEAAARFGDHEGMTRGRILRWLGQFADEHLPLAATLLGEIRYYGAGNIRAMVGQLVAMVRARFPHVAPARIWFVPAGDVGSSAGIMARALRDIRPRLQIISFTDIESLAPADVNVIVFVDDFSGTGEQ